MPTLGNYDQKDYSGGYKKRTLKPKPPKKPGYDRRKAAAERKGETWVEPKGYDRKAAAEKRKNGTAVQAAAIRRTSSGGGHARNSYAEYLEAGSQTSQGKANRDAKMGAYRRGRVKMGAFKGNYYGPDQFKGDLSKVDAWRKAGGKKSDIKKFAKK